MNFRVFSCFSWPISGIRVLQTDADSVHCSGGRNRGCIDQLRTGQLSTTPMAACYKRNCDWRHWCRLLIGGRVLALPMSSVPDRVAFPVVLPIYQLVQHAVAEMNTCRRVVFLVPREGHIATMISCARLEKRSTLRLLSTNRT